MKPRIAGKVSLNIAPRAVSKSANIALARRLIFRKALGQHFAVNQRPALWWIEKTSFWIISLNFRFPGK